MRLRRHNIRLNPGISKLDLASIIVVSVVIVATLIIWFSSYRYKVKTAEAKTNLVRIFEAEVTYYQHSQPNETETTAISKKVFLPLSAQPPEPGIVKRDGNFTSGDWSLLNLKLESPTYYSYSVETKGEGTSATFNAIARGDLDGDGKFSRWEIVGRVNPNGEILGKNQIYSLDPLE